MGRIVFILLTASVFFATRAQTFTDDFNDNTVDPAKWGAAINTGNGRLLEQNQRVDYVVSSATDPADASLRPWVGQLPVSTNWEATLQVHNTFNAGGATYKWAAVGLQLKRPGNTNEFVFIELYAEQSGNDTARGFLTSLETPNALYGDVIAKDLGSTDAYVKLSWDAATGILITSYDRDGPAGVYGWEPVGSFNLNGVGGGGLANRDWNLSAAQSFTLNLSGFSQASVVPAGQIWADNFSLTIASPPATPTLLTLADDFNDNAIDPAKWAADINSGNGRLFEQNQRVEYRVTSPASGFDEAIRPWVGQLPIDSDWEATVDVHNGFVATGSQWASTGIQLRRPGAAANEKIYLELYSIAGPSRGFFTSLQSDTAFYGDTFAEYNTTEGTLRLAFDALTKIVTVSFDRDGAANGFGWQPLATFGLAGSGGGLGNHDWALSASQKFTLTLYGYSELATISSGQVSLDNFTLSIVQTGAPRLTVVRENTNLRISWPAASTGYTLQSKTSLSLASWTNLTTPTTPIGDTFQAVIPITGQTQFFRLQK